MMRVGRIAADVRTSVITIITLVAIAGGVLLPVATVAGAAGDTPVLASAASRKVHGPAGTFDLPLSLNLSTPTTEPRLGPAQTLVFIFDKLVTSGAAFVAEGTATIGTVTFSGSEMIVPLSGVVNPQYITVAVTNVVAVDGGTGGTGAVRVGFLQGDVSNNRVVTVADLGQVNAQIAQAVSAANFLKDINANGAVTVADKAIANTHITKALGAVPPPANQPPHTSAGTNQTITLPASATLTGSGSDDGMPNPALTFSWTKVSGPGTVNFTTPNAASTSASFGAAGTYVLRLTSSDGVLINADDVTVTVNGVLEPPPDPSTVAPAIDRTVATHVASSTAFLYTGANPIQTGVAPGTVEAIRAAVVRGSVHTRDGAALAGVTITVLGHPELGQTLTRADGAFDLAVNGGGLLTVNYQKTGFLPVQRQVNVPWQNFVVVPDVVAVALDTAVTAIALNAPNMQVARGSTTSDVDGGRRATVLIPQGTTANLVMPNGSTQPMSALNVRATEYTVGPTGLRAMPAILPPTSGYTYAVELSADEAFAAGANSVVFNQPLFHYVENFLGFPVGSAVPSGYYDRAKAAWIASANGRVVKITSVAGGFATVDSVGTGALSPLVLTDAERQQLALLYSAGQELWRVPITHFTPWDCNWPYGPPDDAVPPPGSQPIGYDPLDNPTCSEGSIVECENQTLGESVALVGTSTTLNYRSNRVPALVAARTLRISLSGPSVPASLKRIELDVQIAGRSFKQNFAAGPDQNTVFTWDGLDAYGRAVQGIQPATVNVGFVYGVVYKTPAEFEASFGVFGGAPLAPNRAAAEITAVRSFNTTIGAFDARALGLGGWTLAQHHFYDSGGRVLHLGTGGRRGADSVHLIINTAAGGGPTSGNNGDGGPASKATPLDRPGGIAVGPDGSVYIAEFGVDRVRKIGPDGIITTVAGTGQNGFSGDGGAATLAKLSQPRGLAVGPDGALYIADSGNLRIRRVGVDGVINTVAGNGTFGFSGDGGPATQASFVNVSSISLGPDGSIYIADHSSDFGSRVRRVAPDGTVNTFAGNGTRGSSGDEGPATQATISPVAVAVAPDGSLYIAEESSSGRVRRVAPDGVIKTVAGNGIPSCFCDDSGQGDGGPATQVSLTPSALALAPDGTLYIGEFMHRVRRVGLDGLINTIAGRPVSGFGGDNGPARRALLESPRAIAVGPDGSLYFPEGSSSLFSGHIRRVGRPLPGFSGVDFVVASADGSQLFGFDASGRHLRTLNALTGALLLEFSYDANGRLTQVTQKTGGTDNVTTIQRDGNGSPTKIVGPYGQETLLAVDGNGFLSSIANPAGEAVQITSTAGGLLQTFTDPRGKVSQYAYDLAGLLVQASDPANGTQTLVRTDLVNGHSVTRTTALGRATTYKVETLATDDRKSTTTLPGGEQSTLLKKADGTNVHTRPDGMVTTSTLAPDPRFGMQAPFVGNLSIATPNGLIRQTTTTATATLADPENPLSLVTLTRTSTVNGRTTTSTYNASTRTYVTTTPTGRMRTGTTDAFGRLTVSQTAGVAAVNYAYDSRGRLSTVTQGTGPSSRAVTYAYNAQGFVQTITDPIGRVAQFTYDAAGRIVSRALPGGGVTTFTFDAAGNVTSLTPPGRPAHTFGYSNRNELTQENPPALAGTGPTNYTFDNDRMLVESLRPDNRTTTIGYDAAGRAVTRSLTANGVVTGTDTMNYDSAGRISNVAAASGIGNVYSFDGALVSAETWNGAIAGTVSRTYDAALRLATQSVNGAQTVAFTFDNDNLLLGVGAITFTRNGQNGLPTGSSLGVATTSTTYDSFGEPASLTVSSNGSPVFIANLTRDKLGRITQKSETVGGVTDIYVYTHDASGQLTLVTKNGAAVESYAYDSNGNRTSATIFGSSAVASHDSHDRLLQQGAATFAYNGAGDLISRTIGAQTTTYQYDQIGNLKSVTPAGASVIDYIIDGNDRRVGKKVGGALVKGFLYGDFLRPVAELDAAGNVVSRFVYAYGRSPFYMVKGGVNYRIVTDHIGSVRLVIDATTGAIAQRIDYDAFGNVLQDTNPGFQPFGFAGGIHDADTGLVRFGARDYDPVVGRWTAKDPIGFGGRDSNLYRYVRNDPVNFVDPLGTQTLEELERRLAELKEAGAAIARQIRPDRVARLAENRKLREQITKQIALLKNGSRANAGNPLLACLLGALDFLSLGITAALNDHSFSEELEIQDEAETAENVANGVDTSISCLGPFCMVFKTDESGQRMHYDPIEGGYVPDIV